jgi:hypothetical protein
MHGIAVVRQGSPLALTLSAIRLLARAHKRSPFRGPILTFGRQGVFGTLDQCREAIRSQGVEPRSIPEGMDVRTNVPAFKGSPVSRNFTNDGAVFHMLCGIVPEALDVSDYEGADHIHDLNTPVPEGLRDRFGTVIDVGTLEHVFDAPQTLRNAKAMLATGGRIIHLNPMSNQAEHGFYQLSPTLYHDFYVTNGFRLDECLILGGSAANVESLYVQRAKAWRWRPERPSAAVVSRSILSVWFEATKTSAVPDHVPFQGEGTEGTSSSQLGGVAGGGGAFNRLRERALRMTPAAGRIVWLGKKILRRDLSSEPWGLELVGRF